MSIPTYGVSFNVDFFTRYLERAPIQVDATVAIVGTTKAKQLKYFPSVKLALAATGDYEDDSTAKQALLDLDACGTECKVIISGFLKDNNTETHKANALQAIADIENSEKTLSQIPTFIVAPGLKGKTYFDKMKTISEKLLCIFFWETEKKTLTEIKTEVASCKSPRAVTSFQDVSRSDSTNTVRPLSVFILGNWLRMISQSDRGLGETFSNKNINGINGIVDIVEHKFTEDKDSNEFRKVGVTVAIKAPDMLFWGDGVREERALGFTMVGQQLIVDLIQKRLTETLRVFIDLNITDVMDKVLGLARSLVDDLKTRQVIYEYEVTANKKKNTPAALAAGKMWTLVKVQMNSFCKFIGVDIVVTDEFSKNLVALQG